MQYLIARLGISFIFSLKPFWGKNYFVPVFKRPHFEKLLSLASQGRIAPVYLFVGDLPLAQDLSRRLTKHFRDLGQEVQSLDLSEKAPQDLKALFGTPCLLGRKIFVLEGAENALARFDEDFISFLEKAKSWLTILAVFKKLRENHPLYLYALEKGVIVPLPEQRERDLLRYEIPEILATFGKKMDRKAAEELVALVGEDLHALEQEIEKLSLYVGDRPIITEDDLREVVSPRPESALYALVETYLKHGPEGALKTLEELLTQGIHPLALLSTLITYFKRLYLLSEVLQKAPELSRFQKKYIPFRERFKEVLKELFPEHPPRSLAKFHPYAVFKMLPLASHLSPERFPAIFSALVTVDSKLKRGGAPLEEFYAFFLFLSREIQASPQGGRAGRAVGATSPGAPGRFGR